MNFQNPTHQPYNQELDTLAYRADTAERGLRTTRIFLVLVLLGLIGVGAYAYQLHESQEARLGQLPTAQAALASLGGEIHLMEQKLTAWSSDQQGLSERLQKLERATRSNLQLTRKFAQDIGESLRVQLSAEMNQRADKLDARMEALETQQEHQKTQMAALEQDVRKELTALRADSNRGIARVNDRVNDNVQSVYALTQEVRPRRMDFEINQGQLLELTPNLHMQLTDTNVKRQRFDGWVTLFPDGRTSRIREQSAHQAVRLYHKDGGAPYELVITDVGKDFAIGYLLLPNPPAEPTRASNTKAGSPGN